VALDERLRRELDRAAQPADPSGLYEHLIRRRERRRLARKVQSGLLAMAVIAGSVAGVYGLSKVFGERGRDAAAPMVVNGRIAYVSHVETTDDRKLVSVIWSIEPDGSDAQRLAEVEGSVGSLDWSPDGGRLAFVAGIAGEGEFVVVMDADGTNLRRVTGTNANVGVSWSPVGDRIAYIDQWQDTNALFVTDLQDGQPKRLTDETIFVSHPDWSPDGTKIAFAAEEPNVEPEFWDIYVVDVTTSAIQRITNHPAFDLEPQWSPDGTKILFRSRRDAVASASASPASDSADEIYVMNADGTNPTRLTFDDAIDQSPVWSPDGSTIAYTTQCCADDAGIVVMNADGSDPRRLPIAALDLSWQPLPQRDEISPQPSPSPTPTQNPDPEVVGADIGVGFPVCFSERLGGIDHIGDGTNGAAWTAVPAKDDGTCPRYPDPERFIVAADHTGDRVADSWVEFDYGCYNGCAPWDATDLDANGTEELIVATYFSIMDHHFFAVRPGPNGDLRLEPILVAAPGHEPAGIVAGEPLRIDAGGDAGYGSSIECEGYPAAPVIVWSWRSGPIDGDDPHEVHVTRIQLQADGLFNVIDTNDSTVPAGEPFGIPSQTEIGLACGVDWYR
jgi:hypothetical protein